MGLPSAGRPRQLTTNLRRFDGLPGVSVYADTGYYAFHVSSIDFAAKPAGRGLLPSCRNRTFSVRSECLSPEIGSFGGVIGSRKGSLQGINVRPQTEK
jgi:hypothetical protein